MPELATHARGNAMRITLRPDEQAPEIARAFVRHRLRILGTPRERTDDACVIANELATNVVEHVPHAELFWMRVGKNGRSVVIQVWDPSPARPVIKEDPEGESGRGLLIVAALARTWYCDLLPPEHGGGKIVAALL